MILFMCAKYVILSQHRSLLLLPCRLNYSTVTDDNKLLNTHRSTSDLGMQIITILNLCGMHYTKHIKRSLHDILIEAHVS